MLLTRAPLRLSLLFLLTCCGSVVSAPVTPVRLSTRDLSVVIGSPGGMLVSIENRLTHDTKNFRDIPFRLATTRGEISPSNCALAEQARATTSAIFVCTANGLRVEITYRIEGGQANAVRKLLSVRNEGSDAAVLFGVVMFDWRIPGQYAAGAGSYYPGGINEIGFHKSGLFYDHSINLFLRDEKGGLFAGIENPFFQARYHSNRKVYPARVEMYYEPRWVLPPGQTFEGDAGFLGVYRNAGVFRLPPEPRFFDKRERLKAEILDWGEVWAMQQYMASYMSGAAPRPDDFIPTEYSLLADPGTLGRISARKARGEPLTAEEQAMLTHFGGGPFDFAEKEVWHRLTPATVAVYKKATDDAASLGHFRTLVIPNLMAGHKGWFESAEEKQHRSQLQAMADKWYGLPAYPLWQDVASYAGAKGIGMFNFEIAGGVLAPDHPQWRYMLTDGTPAAQYCYANPQFAAWHAAQVDKALSLHPISHWQWDEGWMDSLAYNVAGFIGDDAYCYAPNHGHLPGNIRYQQFHNVMSTLQALRQQHPNVRFVIISGLIPGMPWIMKYLNNDSHTGTMEYGAWGDHNIYFLPPFKSHRRGAVNWLARGVSSGDESNEYSNWYTMLETPQLKAAWKENWDRWMKWAEENAAFLAGGRDLFEGPRGPGGLQGSAHFRDDRGWLFVRNPGVQRIAAEIPLNGWLGLERGEQFQVEQVYPERAQYGVWLRGHAFRVPVPPHATLLLHVQAVQAPVDERPPAPTTGLPVDKAFLTLEEVFRHLDADDFWTARAMPGRDGNPSY